jgi:hypothetical protein
MPRGYTQTQEQKDRLKEFKKAYRNSPVYRARRIAYKAYAEAPEGSDRIKAYWDAYKTSYRDAYKESPEGKAVISKNYKNRSSALRFLRMTAAAAQIGKNKTKF